MFALIPDIMIVGKRNRSIELSFHEGNGKLTK